MSCRRILSRIYSSLLLGREGRGGLGLRASVLGLPLKAPPLKAPQSLMKHPNPFPPSNVGELIGDVDFFAGVIVGVVLLRCPLLPG